MKMVDNILSIVPLLTFRSDDDFYHLQIIKRKKEHPDLGSNSYVVKTYYIRSGEYLFEKMPEIRNLCEFHNARAMINLNVRSFEKVAYRLLQKLAGQMSNRDFVSVRKAYESVVGATSDADQNVWIIDVDSKNIEDCAFVGDTIRGIEPLGEKVVAVLPTVSGFHVIAKPFNRNKVNGLFNWDIHKDNPTMLYYNHGNRL